MRGAGLIDRRGAGTGLRWRRGPGVGPITSGGSSTDVVDNRPLTNVNRQVTESRAELRAAA